MASWPSRRCRALGDRGRYLVIGFAAGPIPSVPLNQVLLRNRTVIGIDWGIWALQHAEQQRALLADLLAMVAGGTIDPVHPTEYPLDDVARALEDLLGRRTVGKIALDPLNARAGARCPERRGARGSRHGPTGSEGELFVGVARHLPSRLPCTT